MVRTSSVITPAKISLNRGLDKQIVVHSHNRLLLCNKKEVNNMDGSQIHYSISMTFLQRLNCKDTLQISGGHGPEEGLRTDSKEDGRTVCGGGGK